MLLFEKQNAKHVLSLQTTLCRRAVDQLHGALRAQRAGAARRDGDASVVQRRRQQRHPLLVVASHPAYRVPVPGSPRRVHPARLWLPRRAVVRDAPPPRVVLPLQLPRVLQRSVDVLSRRHDARVRRLSVRIDAVCRRHVRRRDHMTLIVTTIVTAMAVN